MSQQNNTYFIKWDIQNSTSYLFGTVLSLLDSDKIFYKNHYIPSGTVLYKWTSRVHFEVDRYTNVLPRLERGKSYKLSYAITTHPENSTYLKVDIKNIMQDVIDTFAVKQGELIEFEANDQLHSYTIELISSGVEQFVFDCLMLQECEAVAFTVDRYWIDNQIKGDGKALTFLFVEPWEDSLVNIPETWLDKLCDVVVINSGYKQALLYVHKALVGAIDEMIKKYEPNTITCIGYGPISNFAALYYADRYEKGFAKVTDNWLDNESYRDILEVDDVEVIRVKELLFEQYNTQKVDRKMINTQVVDPSALPFLNPIYRLKQLLNNEDGNEYESIQYEYN